MSTVLGKCTPSWYSARGVLVVVCVMKVLHLMVSLVGIKQTNKSRRKWVDKWATEDVGERTSEWVAPSWSVPCACGPLGVAANGPLTKMNKMQSISKSVRLDDAPDQGCGQIIASNGGP